MNGHVNITAKDFTVGVIASYSCDLGYYLMGNRTVECEQDGTDGVWSNSPPICEGK